MIENKKNQLLIPKEINKTVFIDEIEKTSCTGGRDFNTPLSVQKVTEKSIAKRSGLKEGDAILCIGKSRTDGLDHEQAKMEIIRNGNELEFTGMIMKSYLGRQCLIGLFNTFVSHLPLHPCKL